MSTQGIPDDVRQMIRDRETVWCPVCRLQIPDHDHIVDRYDWAQPYGHRCSHGEPCRAYGRQLPFASICSQCEPEAKS